MPKNRFFLPQPLLKGKQVLLCPEESRHIKVMRLEIGESLELVNGAGELAEGKLIAIERTGTEVEILHSTHFPPPFSPGLIQAFPRHTHLDEVIEKSVELGVGTIWLFPGMRSEKLHLSENGYKRLVAISIAAMKQSGRLYLPQITLHPTLMQWQTLPPNTFYGSFHKKALPLHKALKSLAAHSTPIFLIGPESGLADEEIARLDKLGAQGIRLHPNTLRTETAGPFAIGLAVHLAD